MASRRRRPLTVLAWATLRRRAQLFSDIDLILLDDRELRRRSATTSFFLLRHFVARGCWCSSCRDLVRRRHLPHRFEAASHPGSSRSPVGAVRRALLRERPATGAPAMSKAHPLARQPRGRRVLPGPAKPYILRKHSTSRPSTTSIRSSADRAHRAGSAVNVLGTLQLGRAASRDRFFASYRRSSSSAAQPLAHSCRATCASCALWPPHATSRLRGGTS